MRLTQLQQGQRVEFETLDDVAVRSLSSKDSISDSCFKWKVDETSSIEVFQVKQTNVSESVRRQVLYNWLLAYNQKPDISKFTLYVAQGYSINEKAFTNDSEKEYQTIIESDKAVTALVSRVKQIYKDDLTKFKRDYQTICSKSTIERLGDIDELIAEQLITPFHATAADIGKTYFEKRIAELFTRICARIMDRAGQRSPYVCVHAEYMQLCEEICKDISPTQYTPDYEAFRQVFSQDDLTSEITNSREYRQLRYCKLSNSEILDHLSWEQYYSVVIKRAGGWRTESYNEFYMEKGNVLEQLPPFHWEKLFELQQSMSQSERLLALSVEFWMSAMDDLQEVLASEHLFEIIAALQTIGAHKYHDLLLKIMNDDFGDVRFPLDDNQIEQMQPKIEDANRAFWKNKGAEAEFRGAVTNFLITNLDASGHVFEGIDQS